MWSRAGWSRGKLTQQQELASLWMLLLKPGAEQRSGRLLCNSSMDSPGIALSMWDVCQAEAVRSALCQRWEEEALGSISQRRVGKARCYWRRPSAASHRVAQTKPGFSRATNLSRSWCEVSLKSWKANSLPWESPACPRIRPYECLTSLRVLREHPSERAGGVGGAVAIPGPSGFLFCLFLYYFFSP